MYIIWFLNDIYYGLCVAGPEFLNVMWVNLAVSDVPDFSLPRRGTSQCKVHTGVHLNTRDAGSHRECSMDVSRSVFWVLPCVGGSLAMGRYLVHD
jgi:hypothetical protein